MYLHERDNWTDFTWDISALSPRLNAVRLAQGKVLGFAQGIGFDVRSGVEVTNITNEIVASSQIEGVELDATKVRSSVSRHLGLESGGLDVDTHDVDGAVSIMLDAVEHFQDPVTEERLFGWHNALFPTGYSGLHKITVASFRTGPMQVVSGPIGHERIHFESIDASEVPAAMQDYLNWLNSNSSDVDPLLRAGIAHLWFLTIHPFDDGNGRIARTLTELMLSRSDSSPQRYYSMASYILRHRKSYYECIERSQKGTSDITIWLTWFLDALLASLEESFATMEKALANEAFWTSLDGVSLNERQRRMLLKLRGDFIGKLTAQKWAKMCKVSHDTALRDIKDLISKGVLVKEPSGGRSTSYRVRETKTVTCTPSETQEAMQEVDDLLANEIHQAYETTEELLNNLGL